MQRPGNSLFAFQNARTMGMRQAKEKAPEARNEALTRMFISATIVGLLALLLNSLQFWYSPKLLSVASTGLFAAGASFLAGGLIGFLFGIPRTLQGDAPTLPHPNSQAETSQQASTPKVAYQ